MKTKQSFLKKIEKRNKKRSFNDRFQKRLTTLIVCEVFINGVFLMNIFLNFFPVPNNKNAKDIRVKAELVRLSKIIISAIKNFKKKKINLKYLKGSEF